MCFLNFIPVFLRILKLSLSFVKLSKIYPVITFFFTENFNIPTLFSQLKLVFQIVILKISKFCVKISIEKTFKLWYIFQSFNKISIILGLFEKYIN